MPAFSHPSGSTHVPEPPAPSSHCYPAGSAHIYLTLAAVALFVVARLATAQFGRSQRAPKRAPTTQPRDIKHSSPGPECRKDSTAAYSKWDSAVCSPWQARNQREPDPQQAVWTAGLSPPGVGARLCQPAGKSQEKEMEGIDDGPWKDHSGSASRGVSTSNPSTAGSRRYHNTPPSSALSAASDGSGRANLSPRSSPTASPLRRYSGSSDGAGESRYKGKGPMAGESSWTVGTGSEGPTLPSFSEWSAHSYPDGGMAPVSYRDDAGAANRDHSAQRPFSRPPALPPLTPPMPAGIGFPYEDRRHSFALSIPAELDTSFLHQANPDYAGPSTSTEIYSSSPLSATATPRRRSYAKSVAVGIPIPTTTSASSSAETMTSGETFSPSSYPPTSPLLPPPPPGQDFPYEYEFVGGPGGPGILSSVQEIDIHGEILSVMDDAGHGWKRHTRVYGGGICLACAAAGEEGGFYGDKVPLEDRR